MVRKRNMWDSLVRRIYYKYFSQNILYELQIRARNEAADYVQQFMSGAIIFESHSDIIKFALDNCRQHENYLEFGVATDNSINIIASFSPPTQKFLDLMFLMGFQIIGPVTFALKVCLNKKDYQRC